MQAELEAIRGRRRRHLTKLRGVCSRARAIVRARAAARRAALMAQLKADRLRELEALKGTCATRRAGIVARAKNEAEAVQLRKADLAKTRRLVRARERELADKDKRRVSAQLRKSESDDMVLAELPDDLHAVWNRHKRRFRGTEKWSRAEQFLHWVEENPDEVLREQMADAEAATLKELQNLQRAERSLGAKLRSTRGKTLEYSPDELRGLRPLGIDPFAPRAKGASGPVPF